MAVDPWLTDCSLQIPEDIEPNTGFEDSFKPFERLPDSESYISSLENKLAKLQGKSGKPTKSSELVRGLEAARSQHMKDLLEFQSETLTQFDDEEPTNRFSVPVVFRRICPEKQALTAEELQHLVRSDELAKITAHLESCDTESRNTQPQNGQNDKENPP